MNRSFGRHQQIVRAKEREYEKEAHRMANFTQQQTYSMGSLRIVRLANLNNTVFFRILFYAVADSDIIGPKYKVD